MHRTASVILVRHNGRPLVHANLSHCDEAAFLEGLRLAERTIRGRCQPYCILWDITGATVTRAVSASAKALAVLTARQGLSTGSATVGVTGLKRIMARAIKPDMYWARDESDALAWLTRADRWLGDARAA